MSPSNFVTPATIGLAILIAMLGTSATLFARKKDLPRHNLCGVIDHVQYIPVHGQAKTFNDKRTPLPSLPLIFYQQQAEQDCCDGLRQIAATITDKKGRFDLVDVKYGPYWLSTEWNGKAYKYAFDYPFSKDPDITCSLQGIDLKDDGSAAWWVTITLD